MDKKKLIEYWRKNPDELAEYMLGCKLLKYQKLLLKYVWSRRNK